MVKRYEKDYAGGPDSDGDGLSDRFETRVLGTDPDDPDTDGDDLDDLTEKEIGSNPLKVDSDGDRLPDDVEALYETNPADKDTDDDGIDDLTEIYGGSTDATADVDGDGRPDWKAFLSHDNDRDGLTNAEEQWLRTDKWKANTDGDDLPDLDETMLGGSDSLRRNPRRMDGRPKPDIPVRPDHIGPPTPPVIRVPGSGNPHVLQAGTSGGLAPLAPGVPTDPVIASATQAAVGSAVAADVLADDPVVPARPDADDLDASVAGTENVDSLSDAPPEDLPDDESLPIDAGAETFPSDDGGVDVEVVAEVDPALEVLAGDPAADIADLGAQDSYVADDYPEPDLDVDPGFDDGADTSFT